MNFKQKAILSFKKAKMDFDTLKNNMHGWIHNLNRRQTKLEEEMNEIKSKLNNLEKRKVIVY